jgi:DNA-binding transcriptional ArsR family regulator
VELAVPAMSDVDLDRVFRALADRQRRRVVVELAVDPTDAERACSSFDLPVAKSTRTHHWRTLRDAGLVTQRDAGNGTYVRLRRAELEERFPGLLSTLVRLADSEPARGGAG